MIHSPKQHNAAVYNTQLGLAYLKQGDRVRAKRKLIRALDLAPKSADTNAAMAYYCEKTGELSDARNYYKRALSLAPNSGAQLNNYGSFLCRQGSYKEAESYFLKAVKDARYLNTAGAYENAGLCTALIPEYTKAEYFFAKALEQDPQRAQSLYELVRIELKQNHANKALAYIKQYQKLAWHESSLLALAVEASHQSGDLKAEKVYKMRLNNLNSTDHTGANNEYNNFNG
ncbi:type IV pilus biogenesis/stability protein PilW [Legionella massiliensis]|uniref:Type IV pilus biogenesis/stability protein PilW n=2 Tax=Legionella massiliensis TaxID=1034943 RepID=A0A078KV19_9GAMM|nr:type IV pilus biogenesis/stability protein PilW [Legionella massiliensis]CEE14023.1 Tetratricopeptide repeat protein [Legionella massiliensis]